MNVDHYVTSFSYLQIPKRDNLPPFFRRLLERIMRNGVLPFVRILSLILDSGFSFKGVKRFPEYMLEMSDGTKLATDVYLPKKVYKKRSKCPTMLIRLPYWKDSFSYLAHFYAIHGFAVVLQDVRGCAHSEGFNFYLLADRSDGLETLQWIKKQFWYNGKIGMNGGSYFGLTQLCVSFKNEGILTCISPAICSTLNLWNSSGGLNIHSLTTAMYRILLNITVNREKPPVDLLPREIQERYLNPTTALYNDPLEKQSSILKFSDFKDLNLDKVKRKIAEHYLNNHVNFKKRNFSLFFKFLNDFLFHQKIEKDTERMLGLLDYAVEHVEQPVFMLAGWQDMFLEHQLKDFLELQKNANDFVKKHSKMVIGPWAHAESGHPESTLFNAGMLMFYKLFLNKQWFDYWLKEKRSTFTDIDKPPIKYWVMGRNLWRYTDYWPPKEIRYRKLYLHSDGDANSMKVHGKLSPKYPKEEPPDQYEFDPMNPVITRGGRNLDILKGSHDQKDAEQRLDVLVYTSNVLQKGIEITGLVKMVLFAASSAQDTDFMVKLVDVFPNGKAYNILDAGIRARFRNGISAPSLINPDEIIKYTIELGNTSNLFRKGHRIRLEITSSNFPRFDINSNLGGKGKPFEYMKAVQKIYHDKNHPSYLIMPVYSKSNK